MEVHAYFISGYNEDSSGVGTKDKLIGILVPLILCLIIVGALATLVLVKKCKKSKKEDDDKENTSDIEM
jgi:hypothetical protein